jgi:hypothetical protein
MVPLYANGRELLTYYPHVPCGSDVGISVAISSYNQSLFYGVTYDAQAAPDGELFRDFLIESYEELRAAAGVPAMAEPAKARTAVAAAAPAAHPGAQPSTMPHVRTTGTPQLQPPAARARSARKPGPRRRKTAPTKTPNVKPRSL